MITQHQFLNQYPPRLDAKVLILGTIHPHDVENFRIPFFYGNKNSIWNLLSDAFPDALSQPVALEGVLSFLQEKKITVSDTVVRCGRKNPTALDRDLIPEILNENLVQQVHQSQIERILCTSAFGKNNAFKLFYENILGQKLTSAIRADREIMLAPAIFGRPVLVKALYSPSGSSNISLSKHPLYLHNQERYAGSSRPVYDFKVDYYREQFSM